MVSTRARGVTNASLGFSLLELLVSVVLIMVLMGAVFGFMYQSQKRFQGNAVAADPTRRQGRRWR